LNQLAQGGIKPEPQLDHLPTRPTQVNAAGVLSEIDR
jgi:hypothetical protein